VEIREHPNKTFMEKFERFEPKILDSTAIQLAKMCKRKYFFQIVLGKVSRVTPVYFNFGSAYHKFREVLELSYMGNNDMFRTPRLDGDFKAALQAATTYWDKHQRHDPPAGDKFDFMTKLRLQQSCLVAYEHWQKEKQQGQIKVLVVEQPFNVQIIDEEYTSGRFDQIVSFNGKIWGRDFKTSSKDGMYYQRGLTPNDQFTRYTYAESKLKGERVQGQLIEVLYNAKSTKTAQKGPTITMIPVGRTDFELDDWERDELQIRKELDLARQTDTWVKNEGHCIFCPFHSVCKMPSIAGQMSKLDYEWDTRPWDNTKVGVDE
jgi:hypothetical protein